jgi:DNA primase
MNPSGGKKNLEGGAYRCWKTDAMGSLVSLVAECDNIPYDEAEELLLGSATSLRSLENKLHKFFEQGPDPVDEVVETPRQEIELPEYSFLIDRMMPSNFWRLRAKNYLNNRKIPSMGLYVCTDGEHKNRIIVPYYDREGSLIFWNGRTMSDNKKVLRYAKPKHGDQANVLYMTEWPKPGEKVYLMEGEFDAITLGMADLAGCACGGKYLSANQIEMLRGYEIVLAFDADDPGLEALINIGNSLLESGFSRVSYVRPPVIYKDWNKLLQVRNLQTVRAYVERFEKRFTSNTGPLLLAKKAGL